MGPLAADRTLTRWPIFLIVFFVHPLCFNPLKISLWRALCRHSKGLLCDTVIPAKYHRSKGEYSEMERDIFDMLNGDLPNTTNVTDDEANPFQWCKGSDEDTFIINEFVYWVSGTLTLTVGVFGIGKNNVELTFD